MSPIEAALRDLRLVDTLAARDTPLSRIDPRAKALATAAYLGIVVSFDRYALAALLPLALYPAALAVLGEVPVGWLLRKLLLAAPFALLVGIFNPMLDRAPMIELGPATLSAGWVSFLSILVRFVLAVSAALAWVAGTGMAALCAGLGSLGVPRVLTSQFLFLHRYAFVLGGEASRMGVARELRGGGRALSLAAYASLAGHLLLRAFERGERIHRAMVARGFDGEIRSLRSPGWHASDTFFLVGWCAFFFLVRAVDLPDLLGGVILGGAP